MEQRIEKLEAAQPDDRHLVTRIELMAGDSNCPAAASSFDGRRWSPFEPTLFGKRLSR
ncbi:hypothetical protein [Novosphingobium rosa]|uniref:hypothetical protein n=1 Tax=Novosphingobium rosa TaxID=76978 RepID=UPI0012ED91F1|nr:hypothetical protein [Novosphingobium rosa]